MLLGLNGATTMKADLATDIRVAGQAGYDVVEIWAAKLDEFLRTGTLEDVARLLAEAGVKAHAINSIERITFRDPAGQAEVRGRCKQLARYAQAIGCPYIVVVPSPLPEGADSGDAWRESIAVLRELAVIVREHDVGLAFEFLGFPWCSVRTLAEAWAIVREVDRPNVGLVMDTCHFYAGDSTLESIAQMDPAKLWIFHLNDVEDVPKAEITDAHRLLPGEGVIPLREIIRAVRAIGYNGVCSVELFRPEYWEWEPLKLAEEAKRKTEAVLRLSGV
ncbi:MAG TPA: sugar phosphate isomerase/epimerase [Anaerolineae bacterium]|nr:sugar phosphate isomerase/epimerase [Anaerolineae bacterium]